MRKKLLILLTVVFLLIVVSQIFLTKFQQEKLIPLPTQAQIWTSAANGWGEIILDLRSDGRFVLSYDLLEDSQVHYFKGQWQNFSQALILNFDGETPHMSQTDNCRWLDQNSYWLKIFLDSSQSVQCIEVSDLILKKNNQENISDK